MNIEDATREDAPDLASLINLAGEGMPVYLWSKLIEGNESVHDVGIRRAQREEGGFSYRNARVVRHAGRVGAMLIAYLLDEHRISDDPADSQGVVRPLLELEQLAPGTWYVNALATREDLRGRGIGSSLLDEAERQAQAAGVGTMSIIVATHNTPARNLYLKQGYKREACRPMVDFPGALHGGDWELLIKQL